MDLEVAIDSAVEAVGLEALSRVRLFHCSYISLKGLGTRLALMQRYTHIENRLANLCSYKRDLSGTVYTIRTIWAVLYHSW